MGRLLPQGKVRAVELVASCSGFSSEPNVGQGVSLLWWPFQGIRVVENVAAKQLVSSQAKLTDLRLCCWRWCSLALRSGSPPSDGKGFEVASLVEQSALYTRCFLWENVTVDVLLATDCIFYEK